MAALTIVRAYQHSFDSHPNTTLAFTGGCLNAIGDTMAQLVQNKVRTMSLQVAQIFLTWL